MRIEDALTAQAANGHPALIDGEQLLSYRELNSRARAFAGELLQLGLRRGERVSIFLDKSFEAVMSFYAVWFAGGVVVPVNPGLKSAQVEHIVLHSGSVFLISTPERMKALRSGAAGAALFVDAGRIEALRKSSRDASWPVPLPEEPEELAALIYTSGSTGLPKGVALSHGNLTAGARIVADYLGLNPADRILSVLPFNFDYGLNQLLTGVLRGATLVLQNSGLAEDIAEALERFEITGMAGVPALWLQLLESTAVREMRFPKLRYITNSGGALPEPAVLAYRKLWPLTWIFLMYGLTEAFRSTFLSPEEVDRRPASIGKAIAESQVLVVNSAGEECQPGETGELVHLGPTVALGYWRDAEATSARFRPHPFRKDHAGTAVYSGDLVRTDAEGYLYFVGRHDEMIKSQGYRISPTEVEDVIFRSGLVELVAVKGQPDAILGQSVVAHCVPKDPRSLTREILLAYCRREMPSYMLPKKIEFHAALPLGATGKIDRGAL